MTDLVAEVALDACSHMESSRIYTNEQEVYDTMFGAIDDLGDWVKQQLPRCLAGLPIVSDACTQSRDKVRGKRVSPTKAATTKADTVKTAPTKTALKKE